MEKITKRMMYNAMVNYANTNGEFVVSTDDGDMTISAEDIKNFALHEIELLDKRTAPKEKSEDPLMAVVANTLSDDFETAADIAARVDFEDATVAKVIYRLNQLAAAGRAEKTDLKVPGSDGAKPHTVKGFKAVK